MKLQINMELKLQQKILLILKIYLQINTFYQNKLIIHLREKDQSGKTGIDLMNNNEQENANLFKNSNLSYQKVLTNQYI